MKKKINWSLQVSGEDVHHKRGHYVMISMS
jgi:hypothetical protein